jgi:hypothetical protein
MGLASIYWVSTSVNLNGRAQPSPIPTIDRGLPFRGMEPLLRICNYIGSFTMSSIARHETFSLMGSCTDACFDTKPGSRKVVGIHIRDIGREQMQLPLRERLFDRRYG